MKVAQLPQGHAPHSARALAEIMQTVPRNAHVSDSPAPPYLPPKLKSPDSGDPEVYVMFSESAPSFSRFPDAPRSAYAASDKCPTGRGARMWISRRVGENLAGPDFANLALLRPSISIYSPALRRIANSHGPLLCGGFLSNVVCFP